MRQLTEKGWWHNPFTRVTPPSVVAEKDYVQNTQLATLDCRMPNADQHRISVLCVDDHSLVLDGIMQRISLQPDMEVAATATNGREAVDLFKRHRPDVTVMDLRLPEMSGLDAIRAIREDDPCARIVVLTMYHGHEDIFRALRLGAATYLLKDSPAVQLVEAIREVYSGRVRLPPAIAQRLGTRRSREILTLREMEVLQLMAGGMRNKEIAEVLGITRDTVDSHVKRILRKLTVNDRTAAVTVAIRRGIIRIE